MKIFEFKYKSGEIDWVLATDKEDAIEFYMNHNEICKGDLPEEIIDIPSVEWGNMYVIDINEPEPNKSDLVYEIDYPDGHNEDDYFNGYKILYTFKEYAEDNVHTSIIATTEY